MKRKAIAAILAAALAISQTASVFAENENVEISFKVGDSILNINGTPTEVETPYVVGAGTTLVPLRVITEAFGSQVEWEGTTQTITLTYPDVNIVLQIDNIVANVNDRSENLPEAPALSENGVTMVPLRFISEEFGADVKYDEGLITIIKEAVPNATATPEAEIEPEQTEKPLIEPEPLITPQPAEYSGKMDFKAGINIYPAKTGALIKLWDLIVDDEDMYNEYDEWGIRISKNRLNVATADKLTAKRVEKIMPNGEIDVTYEVDCKKSGVTLEPDITYYVWPYGIKDGKEHRRIPESFKTLSSKTSLRVRGEVKDITDSSAVLRGIVKDNQYLKPLILNYVFYLGTSEDTMEPVVLDYKDENIETTTDNPNIPGVPLKYLKTTYGDVIYNADTKADLGVTLEPDTTYYWKYMIIWDSEEFTTDTMSFTTLAAQ